MTAQDESIAAICAECDVSIWLNPETEAWEHPMFDGVGPGHEARPADAREQQGRRVREVWIEWAKEQPTPKPSWLVPYDELSEADKEVDRRIGAALWGDGFADGVETGLKMAALEPAAPQQADAGADDARRKAIEKAVADTPYMEADSETVAEIAGEVFDAGRASVQASHAALRAVAKDVASLPCDHDRGRCSRCNYDHCEPEVEDGPRCTLCTLRAVLSESTQEDKQ